MRLNPHCLSFTDSAMKRYQASILLVLAPALLLAAAAVERKPELGGASAVTTRSADLADRDIQIAVWQKALAADSESAIALGQLAGLYMQRARESGDETNYVVAEKYARRSAALRSNRNGSTFVTLASALLAQHRFAEADTVASRLVELEPDVTQYHSMLGEIKLELGDYDAARTQFDGLFAQRAHLSIAPRLARWMEITGHSDEARKLLYAALTDARKRKDMPREQLAWFHLRAGDIDLRNGRLRGARRSFEEGLQVAPDDYRLLSAMSRLEAVEGNPKAAIDYGERAMTIKLDPATLGIIGDAYASLGDTAQARDYLSTMEVAVAGQPGAYHRAWSLFLLDHDLRVGEVLANVKGELQTRRDVYGYDLLAWALYKSGRCREASAAMDSAMRMGTRDAMLFFHAGVIEHSLRNEARAKQHLTRALEINPRFHPTQPDLARAILSSMGKG
jgi:tetratricopeptide (TPR) repeat protein